MTKDNWFVYIKVLVLSAVFASIGNWINTIRAGAPVTPLESLPGMLLLFGAMLIASLVGWLMARRAKA